MPSLATEPLEIIIRGCREANIQYQEQLYRYCYPEMIKICCRYAGDMDGAGIIFNNAMIRIFRSLQKYREEGKFMGWVKSIIIHCCLDFVKQHHKFRKDTHDQIQEEELSIPADVFEKISAKEIRKIINQLPRATAVVFNLYIYEGLTHKQIAKSLDIAEGTSKWHVNEARKIMKIRFENLFTR